MQTCQVSVCINCNCRPSSLWHGTDPLGHHPAPPLDLFPQWHSSHYFKSKNKLFIGLCMQGSAAINHSGGYHQTTKCWASFSPTSCTVASTAVTLRTRMLQPSVALPHSWSVCEGWRVIHWLTSASRACLLRCWTKRTIGRARSPQDHLHAAQFGAASWEGSVCWSGTKPGLRVEWSKTEADGLWQLQPAVHGRGCHHVAKAFYSRPT